MTWRMKRQLIVAAIIFAPIALVFYFFAARFFPAASCFDNRKNQGEIEIDCGGPCASCELKHPAPLSIFWARFVAVRENSYDLAAFIKNPNSAVASPAIEYEFDLFDNFGLIARKTGSTYILPQEELHIIEPVVEISREPTRVEFFIKSVQWEVPKGILPKVIVEKKIYSVLSDGGRTRSAVDMTVANNSSFSYRGVDVNIVILDEVGNLIGTNKTHLENLGAGERRQFKALWPEELLGKVKTVEVEPRINIFDPQVILKPQR